MVTHAEDGPIPPAKLTTLAELDRSIEAWARSKHANIRMRTYVSEIAAWRALTGVEHVGRVFEVGHGAGFFLATCVATGFADAATGIDPEIAGDGTSPEDVAGSRAIFEALRLDVTLRRAALADVLDAEPPGRHDIVVFRNALHHIFARRLEGDEAIVRACVASLSRLRRVLLAPGGHLWIVETHRPPLAYRVLHDGYRRVRGSPRMDWVEKRNREEWAAILRAARYGNVRSTPLPVNRFLGTPVERLATRRIASTFLIAAKAARDVGPPPAGMP